MRCCNMISHVLCSSLHLNIASALNLIRLQSSNHSFPHTHKFPFMVKAIPKFALIPPFISPTHTFAFTEWRKMKGAEKSHNKNGKSLSSEMRKDRKSAIGISGSLKKGGHGGKFTWIGHGYSQVELGLENGALDAKDPNFEDPSEITVV